MKKIALVSCSKNKKDYSCEAHEMYSESDLFNKTKAYIEVSGYDGWFILSAKYKLVNPYSTIDPYDTKLTDLSLKEKRAWAEEVSNDVLNLINPTHVDIFAGRDYRKYLEPKLINAEIIVDVPLEGLGIGEQKAWLKSRI